MSYNINLIAEALSYIMTQASFYKGEQGDQSGGIYFQLPEDQLARELQRRKQQEHSRSLQADKIISENN